MKKRWVCAVVALVTLGMITCASARTPDERPDPLSEAIDRMLTDIKVMGVDALIYGEDFQSRNDLESAFARAYDASVRLLAHGLSVGADTDDLSVKCGVKLDRPDSRLTYRRSDILGGVVAAETAPAFYFSIRQHW